MNFKRTILPALLATAALAAPAPAQASSSQYTIFEAPRELSSDDAELRLTTLNEIQNLGAKWVRVVLYWKNVAPAAEATSPPARFDPSDPGSGYDWERYDRSIRAAHERGLKVLVTLSGPVPTWATSRKSGHTYKPNPVEFGKFASAAARRYAPVVEQWSIWNEPNHPQFLEPQYVNKRPYSPTLYRALFIAGAQGLRAGGETGRILGGETAPRGTPRVVAPVTFAEGFLKGSKLRDLGGYAHHPYTTKAGPFFRPSDSDDVTIGVLSRLTKALNRRGYKKTGLYLTEFGIQSEPDPFVGVPEARQAEYRSIAELIAYRNPRVKAFSQYMMRDDLPREGSASARYSGFESGLRHSSGEEKLAYQAFRLPLVADRRGSKVSLWGIVRPAGSTSVRVEYSTSKGWKALRDVTTNSRGVWSASAKYVRGRTFRVVWRGFAGPSTRVY
jgi:hypothetical protein